MDFSAFDTQKIEEYAAQAKASWGDTPEYGEYEQKAKGRSPEEEKDLAIRLMDIFREFGEAKEKEPSSLEVQELVRKLQDFISRHYYTCSDEVLSGLGRMYAGGGEFTANIDKAAGTGTADLVIYAIQARCGG